MMKTVNSLSGGKTSSYIAKKYPADYDVFSVVCLDDPECKPKDKSLIDYANMKLENYRAEFGEFIATAEDDRTLVAMRDLEQLIGRNIIWVRGKSFDEIINERHLRVQLGNRFRLPSWARRYCTVEMKIEPIFYWWFKNIGEKINMRIGFRFDEYDRMERFFNNSDPNNYKIPVACKTYGEKQQKHDTFNWRYCSFPLVKEAVTEAAIIAYWKDSGWIGQDNLFEKKRQIIFPAVSNCVGCFHKKEETIAAMSILNPEKISWFARQEEKNMGTWFDSRVPYQHIIDNAKSIAKEVLIEIRDHNHSCDSGGCSE